MSATYGVPFFYKTSAGTPINGYELNEYGLLAAYSALGASSLAYVQRVDVNLTDLTASLTRPTGNAPDGTFWLDTSTSVWGIQEWNAQTQAFTVITPAVITDPADVVDASVGDFTPVQRSADLVKESGYELLNSLKFNEVDWTIVVKKS